MWGEAVVEARHLQAPQPVPIYLGEPSFRGGRVGGKSILTVIKPTDMLFPNPPPAVLLREPARER